MQMWCSESAGQVVIILCTGETRGSKYKEVMELRVLTGQLTSSLQTRYALRSTSHLCATESCFSSSGCCAAPCVSVKCVVSECIYLLLERCQQINS